MVDLVRCTPLADPVEEYMGDYAGRTVSDIIRREFAHNAVSDKFPSVRLGDQQAYYCDSDDRHLLNYMPQLKRLYINIVASDDSPVEPVSMRGVKRPGFKLTKLGKHILRACQYFAHREAEGRNWGHAYAHHEFHPVVAVLFGAVMQWWKTICRWETPERVLIDGGPDMEPVEGVRDFARSVRHACRSQAFKNLLQDHERKAKDNFRSGCNHITKLFERQSRLLVLRIDLYFRPDAKGWGYSKAADRALSNYLRALRLGRIVPGYLTFIIKRENGISRGMHYHLMVFLDGHLHRNACHLTEIMGEAWMARVGAGRGSYFNCYANKDLYHYNGLGLVHVGDIEKLIGIRIAMWYMSKQDSALKVDESKVKNFWRGWKVKGEGNRGAPRKNGSGMDLVRRMLSGERSKYPQGFQPQQKGLARESMWDSRGESLTLQSSSRPHQALSRMLWLTAPRFLREPSCAGKLRRWKLSSLKPSGSARRGAWSAWTSALLKA